MPPEAMNIVNEFMNRKDVETFEVVDVYNENSYYIVTVEYVTYRPSKSVYRCKFDFEVGKRPSRIGRDVWIASVK